MPGTLGVHVRRIQDGARVDHNSDRDWYLASVVKVPVAMAILEKVSSGEITLDETLILQEGDFVDGAGDLVWQDPGLEISIGELVGKSIRDSDSVATDMLIRRLGEDHLNRRVRAWVGRGFQPITTILQVRYDVYGQAHPGVADLDNRQIVSLRAADAGAPRLQALAGLLGVDADELDGGGFDALFDAYYATGRNAAPLPLMADLLERLEDDAPLARPQRALLLDQMGSITTGDSRIAAGLPQGSRFAQKTGTQIRRACNVGIVNPGEPSAVIVAACAEDFEEIGQAERAFAALGRALADSGALGESGPAD
jgi:beta-lactamase class A